MMSSSRVGTRFAARSRVSLDYQLGMIASRRDHTAVEWQHAALLQDSDYPDIASGRLDRCSMIPRMSSVETRSGDAGNERT